MMLGGQGSDDGGATPPGGEGLEPAPAGLMPDSTTCDDGDGGEGTPTAPDTQVGKLPVAAGGKFVLAPAKLLLPRREEGLAMSAFGEGEPSAPGGGVTSTSGSSGGPKNKEMSLSRSEDGGSPPAPGEDRNILEPEAVSKTKTGKAKGKGPIPATSAEVTGPSSPQRVEGPPALQKFANKEKVLCYYGPLLYEARILKSNFRKIDREWTYLIHYNGWNKKWDAWVDEARLLKYSDENLKLQADLKDANDKELAPKADSPAKASSSGPGRKNVAASDAATGRGIAFKAQVPSGPSGPGGRERETHPKPVVKIEIPQKLKLLLVDDWTEVIGKKRLAVIPAKVTIAQIFTEYLQGENGDVVEVCAGLSDYFNALIGTQLLCPSERQQYEELLTRGENKKMTEYYGVTHLMRLFTKLGGYLTLSNLEPEVITVIEETIPNFFNFLMEKYDTYYSPEDYIVKE